MVKLSDTLFIDECEVSLRYWNEFSNLLSGETMPDQEIIGMKPYHYLFEPSYPSKEMVYLGLFGYSEVKVNADSVSTKELRLKSKTHSDYPIVGVTYEQAKAFCKWRTEQYNLRKFSITDTAKYKVIFDLPSTELYKQVIPQQDSILPKCAPCPSFNYNGADCKESIRKNLQFIAPGLDIVRVDAYWPTENMIWNLNGNVSEMTNEKGVAMGGSYLHYASQCYANTVQHYEKAEGWLGFRCVATIVR